MTILNVGTYPPKQCGIATFSMDFRNSLTRNNNDVKIMAISDDDYEYRYPDEVIFNLKQNQKQDYLRAATFVNSAPDINLLVIQHEYGIYGGKDGEYITEMVKQLHKPYVLITHTVLPHPSKHQKQVLNNLCHRAAGIACMTQRSADLLTNLYEAPAEIIKIIPHGVPEFKKQPTDLLKRKYSLEHKDIISTFGLIGPGKGLELGIQAMAEIAPDYPDAIYMILGQTHPMLQKKEGEKYRQMLESLVYELKLEKNVLFVNKFLSDEELGEYLYMTDIFLSPYPNKDQAVSGTLSFAIGCGRAIVSTSYAFASEMLQGGKGLLAENASPDELASLVRKILADKELKSSLQSKALELGQSWSWPNIGKQFTSLFNQLLDTNITEESSYHYARL